MALFRAFADNALFGKTIIARTLDAASTSCFRLSNRSSARSRKPILPSACVERAFTLPDEALLRDQLRPSCGQARV